jgi:hypothetical protein
VYLYLSSRDSESLDRMAQKKKGVNIVYLGLSSRIPECLDGMAHKKQEPGQFTHELGYNNIVYLVLSSRDSESFDRSSQ